MYSSSVYRYIICGAVIFSAIAIQVQSLVSNAEIASGSNLFGYDATGALYTDSASNVWLSPFCISSCFSLVYPGAAGTTQTEIADVMHFPQTTSTAADITTQFLDLQALIESSYDGVADTVNGVKPSIIGIANKIYASQLISLKDAYVDALYDSVRQESFIETGFDFSASNVASVVNAWVSDNTNGLIDSVLDDGVDYSDWRLLALNAIYLNATFASQFVPYMTSAQNFYADSGRSTPLSDIHLMHQTAHFPYYTDGAYQFLKFAFRGDDDLFALFVLPINRALYATQNALLTDVGAVQDAIANLQSTRVALALPKLSIETKYDLIPALQALGMNAAFDASAADFSGITDDADLVIDAVIHKAMVEMDENGLLAAAVTAIGVGITSVVIEDEPVLFKADHPFQMFIVDGKNENTILFMGQVNEPGIPAGSETPSYDESASPIWTNYTLYSDDDTVSSTTAPTTSTTSTTVAPTDKNSVPRYSAVFCATMCTLLVGLFLVSK